MTKAWMHFHDEGQPIIGSGRRLVEFKVGRKWVYAREVNAVSSYRKRFTVNAWKAIGGPT